MILLSEKLKKIGELLAAIEPNCYHYFHTVKNAPYIIWAEDGEADSLNTDNHKTEQVLSVDVDYFTKVEYDPQVDAIQALFDTQGWRWALTAVQFEDDTGLIHFTWGLEIGAIQS